MDNGILAAPDMAVECQQSGQVLERIDLTDQRGFDNQGDATRADFFDQASLGASLRTREDIYGKPVTEEHVGDEHGVLLGFVYDKVGDDVKD